LVVSKETIARPAIGNIDFSALLKWKNVYLDLAIDGLIFLIIGAVSTGILYLYFIFIFK
jgi:hypothetical protein